MRFPVETSSRTSRFLGFGIKTILMFALLLLVIEIVLIVAIFGSDLIFTTIDPASFAPGAQQAVQQLRQSVPSCGITARTFAALYL